MTTQTQIKLGFTFARTKLYIYATGNTYPYRSLLKSLGFKWEPYHRAWIREVPKGLAKEPDINVVRRIAEEKGAEEARRYYEEGVKKTMKNALKKMVEEVAVQLRDSGATVEVVDIDDYVNRNWKYLANYLLAR